MTDGTKGLIMEPLDETVCVVGVAAVEHASVDEPCVALHIAVAFAVARIMRAAVVVVLRIRRLVVRW